MSQKKLNSKLEVALNQWFRIRDKELAISSDLRKHDVVAQAEAMILKIKGMMK